MKFPVSLISIPLYWHCCDGRTVCRSICKRTWQSPLSRRSDYMVWTRMATRLATNPMWRPGDMINSVTSYTQIHCESRRSLIEAYELFIQTEKYFRTLFSWNTTLFQCVMRPHVSGQCSLLQRSTGPTDLWMKPSPTPQWKHQVLYFIFWCSCDCSSLIWNDVWDSLDATNYGVLLRRPSVVYHQYIL